MANYVLVAGAWLGSWAWEEVAAQLRAAGHGVHPLTLSGLAERQGEPAGQQTHVRDVVSEVERLDLREVVLVGHSYSGIPVGQAAERIGDRLARVVFVDANVPVDGEAFEDAWSVRAEITAHGGFWPPPAAGDFEGQGLTAEQVDRLVSGATPHPGATLTEPAQLAGPLSGLPALYVKCLLDGEDPGPVVTGLLEGERWSLVQMETGHWPMLSAPAELARILSDAARVTHA
ncbi:alpha/beta fold hydrolase [Streptomyces sp. NPDC059456]|uniref:alpha/beta fold hydrolase n=1 Tax=Streptomyces sp. NPDC059456 TaxID=3346838 RepID=UPI00368D5A58